MQLGYNLLFKPKYNQMSCGLFGAAADDVSKININKLKILGIYNDVRGGHSCGMSIDGDIIIGVDKHKIFKDFIAEYDIAGPDTLPVVLGHTRMATGGQHNMDNAHPFGFGSNGDFYDFIGTHNGTLHNEDDLAEEYKIATKVTKTKNGVSITRHKIDSEILLEIIYNNGFKVLEKYQGAAALAMYNTKKPNTIYLYHGASIKTAYSTEAVEERPLFYYQESENVFYYSSLKNSLEAINDNNGEMGEFRHNVVYEIKKGNISTAKKHLIDRSKAAQINASCSYKKHTPIDYTKKEWDYVNKVWVDKVPSAKKWDPVKREFITTPRETAVIALGAANSSDKLAYHHIEYEKIMTDYHTDKVYYENLRFYMNKKLLSGIYILTRDEQLIHVCNYNSLFYLMYDKLDKDDLLLFKEPIKLYFLNGIRMYSEIDYNQLQNTIDSFTIEQLSYCTPYPIRDISKKDSICYFKGVLATMSFSTLFGKDIIKLNNGTCKEIIKKAVNFTDEKAFYLEEDIELLNKLKEINKPIVEIKENSNDDSVMLDLYKENIMATVEYCTEDCDVSISNNYVQNQLKSKFDKIKEFVLKTLTI